MQIFRRTPSDNQQETGKSRGSLILFEFNKKKMPWENTPQGHVSSPEKVGPQTMQSARCFVVSGLVRPLPSDKKNLAKPG
jgi:hypothetical protein